MAEAIRNHQVIREILRQACERSGVVILATPYLRVETSFLAMEGDELHCLANMDHEDAKFGLRSSALTLRFPHGKHFYQGATRMLGLGRARGRQSLRLALPQSLQDSDHRGAYRTDRVGRVSVTFSTRNYDLLTGTLLDVSATGLRLLPERSGEEGEVLAGDVIHVAFTLGGGLQINAKAKVRHLRGRSFGAEFRPSLPGEVLQHLSDWVFQRREEIDLAPGRGEDAGRVVLGASEDGAPRPALVLVSGSAELEERLAGQLGSGLPRPRRIGPTIQAVRELGQGGRALVLLHLDSPSWEAQKRIKTLAEALPRSCPFVILATGVEGPILAELGAALKAAWTYPLGGSPGTLFPRLLQGIYNKSFDNG